MKYDKREITKRDEFYYRASEYVDWAIEAYKNNLHKRDFDNITFIEDKKVGAQVYIVDLKIITFVVFRGTDEFKDWKFNLNAWPPKKYHGFKVHRGFAKIHKKVWDRINKKIDELYIESARPCYFIGHSLGAILAEISALVLARQKKYSTGYFAYGKPNGFSKSEKFLDFAEMPNLQEQPTPLHFLDFTVSVVNPDDTVTVVPALRFGPFLFQTKIVTEKQGTGGILNPPQQNYKLRRLFKTGKNHSMSKYKDRIRKMDHFLIERKV